jgi:type VI secretion system secreted protein VgrG
MTLLQDVLQAHQNKRLLRLSFPHEDAPPSRLMVNRFSGMESLSRDFQFTVELLSDDASIALETMQGKLLCVSLVQANGNLRPFTGYVAQFKLVKADGGVAFYEAILVPWLNYARLRQNNRLFHNQNLEQQTGEILKAYGRLPDWQWKVSGEQPPYTMCTQWSESDHNYLSRRWEAAGYAYWYDHTDKGHTLTISDDTTSVQPIDAYSPNIRFHTKEGSLEENAIAHWSTVKPSASAQSAISGFDFKRPYPTHVDVPTINQQGDIPRLEVHSYEGHYGFSQMAGADRLARQRMEEIEARGTYCEARGNNKHVAPGKWFRLTDHFNHTGDDNEFLILDVHHEASNNYLQGKGAVAEYKNSFTCQPRNVPWRPGCNFASLGTKLWALQTALVVGPDGQGSLNVDQYGRVQVRFHWDRDGTSSCWVRVATNWAGGEKGLASHPRVGSEVVVQWLDGNPDHPLITGCVHNQSMMPPWKLPEQQALTGFRSRELTAHGGNRPGGRSNHLVLDDTANRIQVQLKSDHQTSQLSLGYITRIDNNAGRKEPRGQGLELRTDGHGAVRAQQGLLITTEARPDAEGHITDMAETLARMAQGRDLHDSLSQAAQQAQAHQSGDQDQVVEAIRDQINTIKGQDNAREKGRFPEFQSPHLTFASPAGIQASAEGSTHVGSTQHNVLTSGGHASISAGKSLLVSVKEAVRLFAYRAGMKLVAAGADIDITALKESVNILAKLNITHSANRISITAKEEVVINGGGSYSRWNASGIEQGTNGKWRSHAAQHAMVGPANGPVSELKPIDVALKETPPEHQVAFSVQHIPGPCPALFAGQPYTLLKDGAEIKKGLFDEYGRLAVEKAEKGATYQVRLHNGTLHDVPIALESMESDQGKPEYNEQQLSNKGYRADGLDADKRLSQRNRGTSS